MNPDSRLVVSPTETRILAVAPSGRDARLAEKVLVNAGFSCLVCADLEELSREIKLGAGAVLIADEALTPIRSTDADSWVGWEPPWSQLPMVVLTGERMSSRHSLAAIRRLEQRANATFLQRPVPRVTLISTMRAALESRRRQYVVRDLLEKLQNNVHQRDTFLATLGHELRNPLAAIRSGADLIRLYRDERAPDAQTLDIIDRNIVHMVRLIDDLLDVARITMGKIAISTEPTDLKVVVERAIDAISTKDIEISSDLSVDVQNGPLMLEADPVRLMQIVNNLLDNAVKYTTGADRKIRITARRDAEFATLAIRDNGIGLTPDTLNQVFEMFTQVDSKRTDGLGIGLALTRALVEMHGGSIDVRSEGLGEGCEFIVRMPLARTQHQGQIESKNRQFAKLSGHRVLIVDDNRDAADAVGRLIELLGADIRVTYDGASALKILDGFLATAVLLDIDMPGMDGYELGRRIREHATARDCLLIALTGWGQNDHLERAKGARLDHHLVKPVQLSDLEGLLRHSSSQPPRSSVGK